MRIPLRLLIFFLVSSALMAVHKPGWAQNTASNPPQETANGGSTVNPNPPAAVNQLKGIAIDQNGNVGMGTSAPTSYFQIVDPTGAKPLLSVGTNGVVVMSNLSVQQILNNNSDKDPTRYVTSTIPATAQNVCFLTWNENEENDNTPSHPGCSVYGTGAGWTVMARGHMICLATCLVGLPVSSSTLGGDTNASLSVSPGSFSFVTFTPGTAAAPQTLTLTNTGSDSITIYGLSFSGSNPGDYTVLQDVCTATQLATGATCSVQVEFTDADSSLSTSATLDVNSSAASSPNTVTLSGTAKSN